MAVVDRTWRERPIGQRRRIAGRPGFFVRIGPGLAALIRICFARSSEHAGASIGNAFDLLRFFAVALARSERFELKR